MQPFRVSWFTDVALALKSLPATVLVQPDNQSEFLDSFVLSQVETWAPHDNSLHQNIIEKGGQGRRKPLKVGRPDKIKKGHMATPINHQSSKRLESIPNQVQTVFGWELKLIDLRVYLKSC